jgi:exodeoxyribonuclease-3
MKLISWNVNGIRACLNKGFEDFFYNRENEYSVIYEND